MSDQTLSLFTDAVLTRLLPIYSEVTLGAIRHFQFSEYPKSAAIAAVGALIASVALYAFGRWLRRIPEKRANSDQQQKTQLLQAKATYWLPWLLILSPTPMGAAVIIASGFFRIRPVIAAAIIIASEALWRLSPVL